jgi:signal transduction histidine kinase
METRLIDDLLDLSRIIHGKLELCRGSTDLHEIVLESIATLQAEATAKGVALSHELGADYSGVVGDAVRLKQVMINLLKNAVKFTPETGSIKVTSELTSDQRAIIVVVKDTGIGMTAAEQSHAFEPFAQGDHAGGKTGSFGGLGLGLAIAQQLVEGHGGTIWAESGGRRQGTRVSVKLPLERKV